MNVSLCISRCIQCSTSVDLLQFSLMHGFKHLMGNCLSNVWFFPSALAILLICLTVFRISGTSVGIYDHYFNGSNHKDSHLIYGIPEAIRSDEWLVNTQMIIAQSQAGYPHINHNLGTGRDMSLVVDVPYKEWSVVFKPQNLAFFVLPIEYAFAFKWWLLLYLLVLSCYFLALRILPGQRLLASLAGLSFGLSPFIFWWYQTITLAPLFYGVFILLLSLRLLYGEPIKLYKATLSAKLSTTVHVILLAYILVAFTLVLYPPFQIPVIIVIAAVVAGYFVQTAQHGVFSRDGIRRMLPFAIALVLAGAVCLAFVQTRSGVIKAIQQSSYPGARVVSAGGYRPFRLTDSFLQPQLQRPERAAHYFNNQSEASNFLLLLPFLFLPGITLIINDARRKRLDWPFIFLQLPIFIFLADMFVPAFQLLYKVTLLDKVPHERLIIGLGIISFIHALFIIRKLTDYSMRRYLRYSVALSYAALCLAVLLIAGKYVRHNYPLFISSIPLIAGLALLFSAIVGLILVRKPIIGMALLVFLGGASIYRTDPLYSGLGPLLHNNVSTTIRASSKPDDTFVALDDIYIENFGFLSGRNSISGVESYPDNKFWQHVEGTKSANIYNRYAHILFSTSQTMPPLQLRQSDLFAVRFTCDQFIVRNVDFAGALQISPVNCYLRHSLISGFGNLSQTGL